MEEREETWVAEVNRLSGFVRTPPPDRLCRPDDVNQAVVEVCTSRKPGVGTFFAPKKVSLRDDFLPVLLGTRR